MPGTIDRPGAATATPRKRFHDINPFPDMFTIGPAQRDHEVAIRAGITVTVPLLLLVFLGRLDLAVFAAFGAFASIYGRLMDHGARLKTQTCAGGFMLFVLLSGTLLARGIEGHPYAKWIAVAATTVIAGIAALTSSYFRLRPGGSLFHIFAFGAVASIPSQPPLLDAVVTTICTIAFALLVGMSSRVLGRKYWHEFRWPSERHFSNREHRVLWAEAGWHMFAAGIAGAIAEALDAVQIGHAYWAMVAAVVPLAGHSARYRVSRGLQRVIGTVGGLLLAGGIIGLQPPLIVLVLVICLLQGAVELFAVRQYVITQALVTPLALLSTTIPITAAGVFVEPAPLLIDRGLQTLVGCVVGIACVLTPWAWRKWVLHRRDPARFEDN